MSKPTKVLALSATVAIAATLTAAAFGSPSQPSALLQAQPFQGSTVTACDRGVCILVLGAPNDSGPTPRLIERTDALALLLRVTRADCADQARPIGQATVASYTGIPATNDGRVIHF